MYTIISVPDDAYELPEQLGTKPKFWYRDAANRSVLFKEGRPNSGDNWAEKVSCEIAALLSLPHARYELAVWRSRKGVVCPNFVPDGARLVLGNEVLARLIPDYPQTKRYEVRQHTVRRVMGMLNYEVVQMPLGFPQPEGVKTSADVFIGYLMLDALVANQDRHHENWGFVLTEEPLVTLAPTFDHASSLGRNERDDERVRRLRTHDTGSSLETYAQRARSALFGSSPEKRPLSTLGAFQEGARISPLASQYWLRQLARVSMAQLSSIFAAIPPDEITEPATEFALRLLEINRSRLLDLRN